MKIIITTYDDYGHEIISRSYHLEDGMNPYEDEILYSIINDTNDLICPDCGGSGEVTEPVFNPDAHEYEPTGTRRCHCKNKFDEE